MVIWVCTVILTFEWLLERDVFDYGYDFTDEGNDLNKMI